MKKTNLKQKRKWKSLLILGLFTTAFTLFVSCDTDEESLVTKNVIEGEYHLLDLTIVNSDNGIPVKLESFNFISDKITYVNDGSFSLNSDTKGSQAQGNWTKEHNILRMKISEGPDLIFEITSMNDDELKLKQRFESQENFASGHIYYTLHKNPEEIDINQYFSN